MIQLVHVSNPVQPSDGRKSYSLAWVEGKRLDEYLLNIFAACDQMTVSINGMVIPADLWTGVVLRDGDSVVASPTLEGGNLLRTLASVAVLATAAVVTGGLGAGPLAGLAAGPLGSFFAGVGLGNLSVAAASAIGAGITVGGNLLVSATLAPSIGSPKSPSSSYDPDGPRSLARSGVVIPKGYGTMRWGGNIIASFPDYEGDQQYMNALVCFGFGPARSITDIQLNGKSVASYVGVQYYTRLGANDQLPIPNFNRVVNGYPQDVQCLAGQPVVVPGTGTLTQILQVDVVFPNGVYVVTQKGNLIPAVITYTVEYSVAGANNWQPVLQPLTTVPVVSYNANGAPLIPHYWSAVATDLPPGSGVVYALDDGPHNHGDKWSGQLTVETFAANGNHSTYQKTFQGEWQPTRTDINQVLVTRWTAGYQDFVGASRSPLYNRTNIYGLAPGKYDVRVTKYGSARLHDNAVFGDRHDPNYGEEIWIHSVNEVALIDLAYPNMILVGVRALATNQLSGANLNVTALVKHGLRSLDQNNFPGQLRAFEEDNPACVAADMMLDPLYGGGQYPGVTLPNLNRYIDEWVAWAAMNEDLVSDGNGGSIRRHVFNGVFDNESNLWEQVGVVGKMSRAVLIPLGKDYGVMTDQPDVPVQMFTMGNIVADSFEETWLAIDDRANQVEISFADSTRYYRTDNPLVYMDPTQQDSGLVVKNVRIDGKGITVPAQAWHLARHKERSNQYLLRTGKFRCDLDAIAVRPGNVAILQHDVPQWNFGGRTLPGSTASVVLIDRTDIPFASGTNYSLIVMHAAVLRYTGTVASTAALVDAQGSAIGTTLTVSGFSGASRVTRAIVNGTDCVIQSWLPGSVVVLPPPGFVPAAGQTVQLYDTDVLETGAVVAANPVTGTVTLQTPLSIVPQDYSNYFYGPVGSQKLIRVVDIKKTSENRATVEWIDYDPNVYIDGTPVVGATSPTNRSQPGVTNLKGSETFTRESGSYVGYASLSWTPGRDTAGVGIYAVLNTGSAANVNTNPKMLERITGHVSNWKTPIVAGQTWTYYVVGFDKNEDYAALATAPNVTIAALGVASNLLQGSSFGNGFTYWNLTPRAGDTWVPTFADDGEAIYTVNGSPMTLGYSLINQSIPPAKWSVGETLLLSAYFEDTCLSPSAPNVGLLALRMVAFDGSGNPIAASNGYYTLDGRIPALTRITTTPMLIPAGTVSVSVDFYTHNVGTIPVGSTITASHFLLEVAAAGQTIASTWADIDVNGNVLDLFLLGKSTGLRAQGSTIPSFTGAISYSATDTTLTVTWNNLAILWPDGAYTYVQDGSQQVTGLQPSTPYRAWPYFDVVNGGVQLQRPSQGFALGQPNLVSAFYDAGADAACRQDGRVPLAPGGLQMTTAATGSSGSGTGGGGGTGGGTGLPPVQPPPRHIYPQ